MKKNNLQEQIKRMKSLMGEERLWGNLVDKEIVVESWWQTLAKAAKKNTRIAMNTITAASRSKLLLAISKTAGDAKIAAYKKLIDRIGDAEWEEAMRRILLQVKINGQLLSEPQMLKYISQMKNKDEIILKALRDGKSADDLVKEMNAIAKNLTDQGFNVTLMTKEDIKSMVFLLYGDSEKIIQRLGLEEIKRIIPDNELIKNSEDILRGMGYTDEEIRAAKEAYTKRVNDAKKTKPKTKAEIADEKKKKKEAADKKKKKEAAEEQARIDKEIADNSSYDNGDQYGQVVDKPGFGRRLWGRMKKDGTRDWKNGWVVRLAETLFWKIRLAPKSVSWIGKHVQKLAVGVGLPVAGNVIRFAAYRSPALFEAWALGCLLYNKVLVPSIRDGELNWEGRLEQTEEGYVERDDEWYNHIKEVVKTIVANNPAAYSTYFVGFGIGKWVWDAEVAETKDEMANWVNKTFLCCPAKAPQTHNRSTGAPLDTPLEGWPKDCKRLNEPGWDCAFPEGPPTCQEIYDHAFVNKDSKGRTEAEKKYLKDFGEEEGYAKQGLRYLDKQFRKTFNLDKDWGDVDIKSIMPNAAEFCKVFTANLDMDKIRQDINEEVAEVGAEIDERIAEAELIDSKHVDWVFAYCDFNKLIKKGELKCNDWKNSYVANWFPNVIDNYDDSFSGFSKCWCDYGNSRGHVKDINECVAGGNAACKGNETTNWCK